MRMMAALLNLLFPPRCVFCGQLLPHGVQSPCASCQTTLPWIPETTPPHTSGHCSACVSVFWYEKAARSSLLRFKFKKRPGYAADYGPLLARVIQTQLDGRFDVLSWMPVSAQRRNARGYDQAQRLAEAVSPFLGLPAIATLEKTRDTIPQSKTAGGYSARRTNVAGAYASIPASQLSGKRILLLDDVMTTGATLEEGAQTVRAAGAADVVAATLCRVRPDSPLQEPQK